MKATELMIGDWVNSDFGIFQIKDIFEDAVRDNRGNDYEFDCIHPIVLTPEILKSNGFELVDDIYRAKALVDIYDLWECETISQTIYMHYYKKRKDYSLYSNNCIIEHIKYVHELQNAMRVCRVENEIELCQQ